MPTRYHRFAGSGLDRLAALTCLIDSYVAIGLIVALQLNAVIAPRIWILDRV
jgi:hypothetical protein